MGHSIATEIIARTAPEAEALASQADNDEQLIELWLHGRSKHTLEAYNRDVRRFRSFAQWKPLAAIKVRNLQAYADLLESDGLSHSSRKRMLSTLKSLLTFGHKLGYLPVNVGGALRLPKQERAFRILTEAEVHKLMALEPNLRNRIMLRLLYASGVRVTELCGLRWVDTADRDGGRGQITVTGKGGKVRAIVLSAETWKKLLELRGGAPESDPIFRSRKGGALSRRQVLRIVKSAGERAGLAAISPHSLRHAHISHSLDRGAPIHVVQQTAGHASLTTTSTYAHARPGDSSSLYLGV